MWCSSTSRSPEARSSRSKRAWKASRVRRWSRKPTPVATRARPSPSRSSETRSAVSVLVRTTSASRPGAGGAAAPSAARRTSFSRGRRSVIRIPPPVSRTTTPRASRSGPSDGVADEDEVAVTRSRVVACGRERVADAPALGVRRLDVEARFPQGRRRNPGGRAGDARGRPAPLQLGGDVGRGDGVPDPQRREPERLRERAQDDQIRQLLDERDAGDARVLEVRLVDDDGRVRMRPRELRDLVDGRRSSPVGLFGLQTQISAAPSGSGRPRRPPARWRSGRARTSARRSRRPSRPRNVRAQSRISSSAPAPSDDLLWRDAAIRDAASRSSRVGSVRVLVAGARSSPRAAPAARPARAACSGRSGGSARAAGRAGRPPPRGRRPGVRR